MKRKDLLLVLAGLLVGAGLGIFLYFGLGLGRRDSAGLQQPSGRALVASPVIGAPAPNFELNNLAGDPVRLSDQQGKVVLINFWATWCGPCRLEMPAIEQRFRQLGPKFTVLAVNFAEPASLVQAFVDELGLTFAVLLDPDAAVQDLYRVRAYPTSFLVDEQGIIRVQHLGIMSEDQLDGYLEELGVTQ